MANSNSPIHFLINPRSGGRISGQVIAKLRAILPSTALSQHLVELDFSRISEQLRSCENSGTIIIGGGDGTISTVLGHLTHHPRVGILPLGTGNDLARELGIKPISVAEDLKGLSKIIENLETSPTRKFYRGCLHYGPNFEQQKLFINYLSFGYDAKIVSDFDLWRRGAIGARLRSVWGNRFGYAALGVKNLAVHLPKTALASDSASNIKHQIGSARSLIFANVRSIMGLGYATRDGSPFDEKIEAVVVKNLLNYGSMLFHHASPLPKPLLLGSSEQWTVTNINEDGPIPLQVDGEPANTISSEAFRISVGNPVDIIVPNLNG